MQRSVFRFLFPALGFCLAASLGYTYAAGKVVVIPWEESAPAAVHSFAVFAGGNQNLSITETTTVRSVSITAPVDGTVILNASLNPFVSLSGGVVQCSITADANLVDSNYRQWWASPGLANGYVPMALTRGFTISADESVDYNLVCAPPSPSDSAIINDSSLNATFHPAPPAQT